MKKRVALILAVVLLLYSSMVVASPNNAKEVVIDLELSTSVKTIPKGPDPYIEYLTANLSFVPQNYSGQEVISRYTEPQAMTEGRDLYYRWDAPVPNQMFIKLNTQVKNRNTIPKIKPTGFPFNAPKELEAYTSASETIDSNDPAIIRQASILATGETDLFSTVFNIAKWTKTNVKYNLSTMTAKASQKASWVLQNRQ